jgi:hypothetical protein
MVADDCAMRLLKQTLHLCFSDPIAGHGELHQLVSQNAFYREIQGMIAHGSDLPLMKENRCYAIALVVYHLRRQAIVKACKESYPPAATVCTRRSMRHLRPTPELGLPQRQCQGHTSE